MYYPLLLQLYDNINLYQPTNKHCCLPVNPRWCMLDCLCWSLLAACCLLLAACCLLLAAPPGVSDAEAFLHERLGDLEAALRLHMAAVEKSNSHLLTALMSGRIPVLQLPGGLGVAGVGVSRPGSGRGKQVDAGLARKHVSDSSSSSNAETEAGQVQWGLGTLLQQLRAAQDAVQPAHSLGKTEAATPAAAAATAAASVAASLLQQLSPAASGHLHPQQQHQHQYQHQALQHPYLSSHHGSTGASSSATALQSTCCVCVDLHKAWMAELSPRLKLKGLGCSTVYSPLQSATGGIGAASNAATAAAAMAEVPQELAAAWQALQAALAFCKRNTKSSSSSGGSSAASRNQRHSSSSSKQHEADDAGGGKQLWFGLMDVYVSRVRSLQTAAGTSSPHKQPQHASQHANTAGAADGRLLESLAAAASRQLPPVALPEVLLAAAAALAGCIAHDLFSLLLDEVVCLMADHLPLLDIVGRVLQQHGSERFGEFRSTLLGLFGATAYESAIMQAANR
jgi:hypothetical protein